jgi:hypothetical protein
MAQQQPLDGDKINDLEDFLSAALLLTWHLQDWIHHDPHIDERIRRRIGERGLSNRDIRIVGDLSNRFKHVTNQKPRAGAAHALINLAAEVDGSTGIHHLVEDDSGARRRASDILDAALAHWQQLLDDEGLPTYT